ncbi:hypothetical protein [Geodermatophilus sp. DSM 45219]|uniref:hypothetical protein n=1 Tax=Geodermatophilus sp. DSM 45219 TaxID=1881103 RepID=UPI00087E6D3D|nr:hypothetical protein [Geodermatophilus sp. DSM 45219]SDN93760.1 hypothetical protein SAMN05428965_2002 [Geodermatophilus sp. DSM 45219]
MRSSQSGRWSWWTTASPGDGEELGALHREAAGLAEDVLARHVARLPGQDVAVSMGMDDTGVRIQGVHALDWDGRCAREHWELLAYRRPGERRLTLVRDTVTAVAATEEASGRGRTVVEGWWRGRTAGVPRPLLVLQRWQPARTTGTGWSGEVAEHHVQADEAVLGVVERTGHRADDDEPE